MKSLGYYYSAISLSLQQLIAESRDQRLRRKIVVFESDDWGAIRVPSSEVHDLLIAEGYNLDVRPYEHLDGLECDNDVEVLAQMLGSFTDTSGHHPQLTLNYLSANPDFEKIKEANFKEYHWEAIEDTYARYKSSGNVINLVKDGIKNGVFDVQFHGREHFDIPMWLRALQAGDNDILTAFSHGMCGIFPKDNPSHGNKYMVALKADDAFTRKAIEEGISEFSRIWGRRPGSFIAPCYTWHENLEHTLAKNGIRVIQTSRFQRIPNSSRRIAHYTGQQNSYNLIYTVRNCSFEPATSKLTEKELVAYTMTEIRKAFHSGIPAIISSHRINYTSRLSAKNAERGRNLLSELFKTILTEFPDAEFCTGSDLYKK